LFYFSEVPTYVYGQSKLDNDFQFRARVELAPDELLKQEHFPIFMYYDFCQLFDARTIIQETRVPTLEMLATNSNTTGTNELKS